MTSFPEALKMLLENTPRLATERISIEGAAGRILREEIHADRDFPPFDRVMMDGFALRFDDLKNSREFIVTASAPAGSPQASLAEEVGTCVEIMTGAPLPIGADCIVPIEETENKDDSIRVRSEFHAVRNRFVHPLGSDAKKDSVLLAGGARLGSSEIGVAASCGAAQLEVSSLPKIAVVATGDELVAVDEIPAAHQIRQSNAHAISCSLSRSGFPPQTVTCLGDDLEKAGADLSELLATCDWIILTGAVSKGAHDYVPALLEKLGCQRLFHGISQRPGKPAGCWIGPKKQVIIGLPGNPVSAVTGLYALVLPALTSASGAKKSTQRPVSAEHLLSECIPNMTRHLPVSFREDGEIISAPPGNSGDFIGLLRSEGFITLPPAGEPSGSLFFTPWI